ncbi:MAG: 6-bladed beta-propeller [Balneolaceae bacterium]
MQKSIFILFLFIPINSISQTVSYSFNEELRIGYEIQDQQNEYLFVFPNFVLSDEKGNVYVADQRLNEIKKFNSHGNYLTTIGQQGRGPGEFVELSVIFLDSSTETEKLVIFDRSMQRVSKFTLNGEYLNSYNSPVEETLISPWMGRANSEGDYFLFYRKPVLPNQRRPENDHLIHVYKPDFSEEKKASFGDAALFGDTENYFVEGLIGGPRSGFFEVLSDQKILVAPFLNSGETYLYEENNGIWNQTTILNGPEPEGEVYRQIDSNNAPTHAIRMGTPRGAVAGLVFNANIAAHAVDEKYIVRYTSTIDDKGMEEIGMSVFDFNSGEFIGYSRVDELSQSEIRENPTQPGWLIQGIRYKKGKIYFIDRRSGDPEIAVAEIKINVSGFSEN